MKSTSRNQKKKSPFGGKVLIVLLTTLVVIGGGVGYYYWSTARDEKAAQTTIDTYITALKKQDYSTMSKVVSEKSLKDIGYTKDKMTKRYETVYGGVGAGKLKVSNVQVDPTKEKQQYAISYDVEMETSLGKLDKQSYSTTMNKVDGDYQIDWTTQLIFPDLEPNDKISLTSTVGERGDILAADGSPLATEGKGWDAGIHPAALGEGNEKENNLKKISDTFDVSVEQLEKVLAADWVTEDSFVPFKVVNDGETPEVPGVLYQEKTMRTYPLNEAAAHLIGYVGEATAEDIEKNPTLQTGDVIGKSGLEATFNDRLSGQKGGRIVINDETDTLKKVLQETEVENGEDITLTINADLQKAAYDQLKGEKGSAVLMDPTDGSLLALVSTPSYDANLMTAGISSKEYQKYADDKNSPFLARYAAGYAPGSTFKTITGAIGLDSGVTTPEKTHKINGLKWQKDSSWGDHFIVRVADTPEVNLESAYVHSDNIYFAQEALEIGQKKYEEGLSKFIFGEDLKLPIAMNEAQISNDGKLDSESLLADTAYGQGQLLLNPIQQAVSYTPFVNEGKLIYPKLTSDQKVAEPKMPVTAESATIIKNDLIQVVENPAGSAHSLASIDQKLAAKTGTAETQEAENADEEAETNGFLLAFDAENNSYLMVALIEGKSSGDVVTTMKPVLEQMESLLK